MSLCKQLWFTNIFDDQSSLVVAHILPYQVIYLLTYGPLTIHHYVLSMFFLQILTLVYYTDLY